MGFVCVCVCVYEGDTRGDDGTQGVWLRGCK